MADPHLMHAVSAGGGAEPPDEPPQSTLMDCPHVKAFVETARERGFVTFDALNSVLPQADVSAREIEALMSDLSDEGIEVVDN